MNHADHHAAIITKGAKDFAKHLDFKDINLPVKIRDIRRIENRISIGISVFGYQNKEKYPIYVSKNCCEEKHVDLLELHKHIFHRIEFILFSTYYMPLVRTL